MFVLRTKKEKLDQVLANDSLKPPSSFASPLKISSGIKSASRNAHTLSKSAAARLSSATLLKASEKVATTESGWSSASLTSLAPG